MTDQDLIARARALVSRRLGIQWELGELALEYAPVADPSIQTGVWKRLEQFADAIGINVTTLRNYRTTVHAWQGVDHEGIGFDALKYLNACDQKQLAVELLRSNEPPTQSGRWTGVAAYEFMRERGLVTTRLGRGPADAIGTLRKTRGALARLGEFNLDDQTRGDLIATLAELAEEINVMRERLAGLRV